ncbi:MAG: lamin tail domain-containing protein, partial [Planctomycetota bacterium]
MKYSLIFGFIVIINLTINLPTMVRAQELIRINEFMAVNNNGLDDEDRDESDWIEIYNAGMNPVNLEGWYLTDDVNDLRQWAFPEVILDPDAYLVVFASGKNRRDPLGVLHTNFRLRGSGEYLGLVRPDGETVAWEFFPEYPKQAPDISYGPIRVTVE